MRVQRRRSRPRYFVADDGTLVATEVFSREPPSVPIARRFVRDAVIGWEMGDLADTAELVASELVSNAIKHARAHSIRVTLRRLDKEHVRVAVIDRSYALPQLHPADKERDHGRGLVIIDAVAQRWDTDLLPWGKRVWADLKMPQRALPPAPDDPQYNSPGAQVVYVLILLAVAAVVVGGLAARQ